MSITVSPDDDVEEGDEVILTCSTDQSDAHYSWTFTPPDGQETTHHTEGHQIRFHSVATSATGIYTCYVTTSHGSGSSNVELNVKVKQSSITTTSPSTNQQDTNDHTTRREAMETTTPVTEADEMSEEPLTVNTALIIGAAVGGVVVMLIVLVVGIIVRVVVVLRRKNSEENQGM